MKGVKSSLLVAAIALTGKTIAQEATQAYTDASTGITFSVWDPSPGNVRFGMAVPSDALTVDADEFIGLLTCSSATKAKGWCGMSFGGGMVENLLLFAYPHGDSIQTSLRYATDYTLPEVYTGNAKVMQISARVNETGYELTFRCQGCLSWKQGPDGVEGGVKTTDGFLVLGWVHTSSQSPEEGNCADRAVVGQHETQGIFGGELNGEAVGLARYEEWVGQATGSENGGCAA
ncbi:hypothetical protein QBC35DRAFT_464515 [Podospora australis]|uniref:Cellobiose dehydrogenase-like cytochrome domain-containing protein n=1 Tax=Podospora australis TaxID=1536484 RepID=A0AAN6WQX4_9PEZI|nr:hypothetical protein QBC35DRAFT_464515 [Podospora australis]